MRWVSYICILRLKLKEIYGSTKNGKTSKEDSKKVITSKWGGVPPSYKREKKQAAMVGVLQQKKTVVSRVILSVIWFLVDGPELLGSFLLLEVRV